LQAHLTAGDQLVVLWAADLDLPELLGSSLLDRDRDDLQRARPVGTQEVRGNSISSLRCVRFIARSCSQAGVKFWWMSVSA